MYLESLDPNQFLEEDLLHFQSALVSLLAAGFNQLKQHLGFEAFEALLGGQDQLHGSGQFVDLKVRFRSNLAKVRKVAPQTGSQDFQHYQ